MNHHEAAQQQMNNGRPQPAVDESIRFMTISAYGHVGMVASGELPHGVHGAFVFMQNANNVSHSVSKTYFLIQDCHHHWKLKD